jgi:hypothetical protein
VTTNQRRSRLGFSLSQRNLEVGVLNVTASLAVLSGCLAILSFADAAPALAASEGPAPLRSGFSSTIETIPTATEPKKDLIIMANETRSSTGTTEMAAAKTLTTKVLAIGSWTAKATPETRPAIMPFEARDTLRLQLAGKIDQWFAKSDGSRAVFLMNVTDPAEAHKLLEDLPLGRAGMMSFELIPMGPLWPLGLLLPEPPK